VDERNEYWQWFRPLLGKKRRVLRSSSVPCDLDCWDTGSSRLKTMDANLRQQNESKRAAAALNSS